MKTPADTSRPMGAGTGPFAWLLLFLAGCAAALAAVGPADWVEVLAAENGPVETLSALLLIAGALVVVGRKWWWRWAHLALLFLLLAEREFEAESFAAGGGVRAALAFVSDDLLHNHAVQAVLLMWLLGGLIGFTLPWFWRLPWRGKGVMLARVVVGALLVWASQALENAGGPDPEAPVQMLEEVAELLFAAIMLRLVWLTHRVPDPHRK